MASLRSEVIVSTVEDETHQQRKDRISKSLKTDWGIQAFGAYYPELDMKLHDYYYDDTSENALRHRRASIRNTYNEFCIAFSFAHSSVEKRLALIHDAALFGLAMQYMTFHFGSKSEWEKLFEKKESPDVIMSICQIMGQSIETIANYALYQKTLYEIFHSLKSKDCLVDLERQLDRVKKFGIDLNAIESWEEEMNLLEYLLQKGCYDIVEKFKLIVLAGFTIKEKLAETMFYLVCQLHADNASFLAAISKYCNQKCFEGIKISAGPQTYHPIVLALNSFEKYAKGKDYVSYENYIRFIEFLLSKISSVDQSVITKLLRCSTELRMKPFLSLFSGHTSVSIEDKAKIKDKMTQLDQLAKQEKLDEEKREQARFRQYMDKLKVEQDQNNQILYLLKSYLAVDNIKLDTLSRDFEIQFETANDLDAHLNKLKDIQINCEIRGGKITLQEYPSRLLSKLKNQPNSIVQNSAIPPRTAALVNECKLIETSETKDTSIVNPDALSKALLVSFGMQCRITSVLENWHIISFESEAPFEKIQEVSRGMSDSGIKNRLEPGCSMLGGIVTIPPKIHLENDTLRQIIEKIKNIKSVSGIAYVA